MIETVWITGATGYTGRFLMEHLAVVSPDIKVIACTSSASSKNFTGQNFQQVDVTDSDSISMLANSAPPTIVFHLAGLAPPTQDAQMWHVNVAGTVNLLRCLASSGCLNSRVICAGSAAEYLYSPDGCMIEESPSGGESNYGRSKWAQTVLALQLGEQLGLSVSIVRPFNIVGPGLPDRFVAGRICEQYAASDKKVVSMGNIYSERDFIDIRDVVSAYWIVAERGLAGEIYNVCSGVPTSIEALLNLFSWASGTNKKIITNAVPRRNIDLDRVFGNNDKIINIGWKPKISLVQSVKDMLASVGK